MSALAAHSETTPGAAPETESDFGDTPFNQALVRVARLQKSLARRLFAATGLWAGEEMLLIVLWSRGPLRPVDLVKAVDLDPPRVTRSIARLERVGLVHTSRSVSDRRSVIVEASDRSRELQPMVESACRELERLTTGGMSAQQKAGVMASLATLEARLESVTTGLG